MTRPPSNNPEVLSTSRDAGKERQGVTGYTAKVRPESAEVPREGTGKVEIGLSPAAKPTPRRGA